jgi:hypothetical protein
VGIRAARAEPIAWHETIRVAKFAAALLETERQAAKLNRLFGPPCAIQPMDPTEGLLNIDNNRTARLLRANIKRQYFQYVVVNERNLLSIRRKCD